MKSSFSLGIPGLLFAESSCSFVTTHGFQVMHTETPAPFLGHRDTCDSLMITATFENRATSPAAHPLLIDFSSHLSIRLSHLRKLTS